MSKKRDKQLKPTTQPLSGRASLVDERRATNPAAKQVLEILERGSYQSSSGQLVSVRDKQADSEHRTTLYTPSDLDEIRDSNVKPGFGTAQSKLSTSSTVANEGVLPDVEVFDATTQVAAYKLAQEGPLVLLNFASARNPGGGFLGGAKAQEEDLCRCSGLYRTLLGQPTYYKVHRADRSLLYSDHLIYSPAVPFFRTAADAELLETPFLSSVITAPAPNAGAIRRNQPDAMSELPATFLRRWTNVLAVAQENGDRTLILGAWGCGAFRNDPSLVAQSAREALALPRFAGAFTKIVFPIPAFNKHSEVNLNAFRAVFS